MVRSGRSLLLPVWLLLATVPLSAQAPVITPAGDPSVEADTIYRLAVDPSEFPEETAIFLLDDGVVLGALLEEHRVQQGVFLVEEVLAVGPEDRVVADQPGQP